MSFIMRNTETARFMTEEELVKRAREGEENACRELFNRHFKRVFRTAIAYVGAHDDEAKDICQTAFMQAFRSLGSLEDPAKFGPWIVTIARRTALNHIKKRKTRAEVPLPLDETDNYLIRQQDRADEESARMEREIVRSVIAGIPDDSIRETVRMYYLEGINTEEIASRQGITKSSVTTRLGRFRTRYSRMIMLRILRLRGESA